MTDEAKPAPDTAWEKGLEWVDKAYGAGSSEMMAPMADIPFVNETVAHLFADIWSRPALSMRDKRLMVMGATTMLGRADLIEVQCAGGIVNGEFTEEQLADMPLLMMFYAGAGNTTMLFQGIEKAKVKARGLKKAG